VWTLDSYSGLDSPKLGGGENGVTLSEQLYLVWDTASQSTKWQDMLEMFGA